MGEDGKQIVQNGHSDVDNVVEESTVNGTAKPTPKAVDRLKGDLGAVAAVQRGLGALAATELEEDIEGKQLACG